MDKEEQIKKELEAFNALYGKWQEHFFGEFHNILWQIKINKRAEKEPMIFYGIVGDGCYELVLATIQGGHYKTGTIFKKGIDITLGDIYTIARKLSIDTFRISESRRQEIEDASFRNSIRGSFK